MCFIPVHFGKTNRPVNQADVCNALELPPSACAMLPAQTGMVSHPTTAGNSFDVGTLSNNLKVHVGI